MDSQPVGARRISVQAKEHGLAACVRTTDFVAVKGHRAPPHCVRAVRCPVSPLAISQATFPPTRKLSKNALSEIEKNLDVEISQFFNSEEIEQLAKESGFVKRTGKINGSVFLDLIVFNRESLKQESLNDLCIELKERHGFEIKRQSLHERFNEYSVAFLKMALEKMLRNQLDLGESFAKPIDINRMLIKDSVCFQIDESLAEFYPGSGGSGSGAAVRIQLEYDILTGKINDLSLNAFNDQDAKNSVLTMELAEEGDLIIRDLAYMSLSALTLIAKKLAFYLCRLDPKVNVYELKGEKYQRINFSRIRKYMNRNNLQMMEKDVYLGDQDLIKVRLVIHIMPAKEVEKRLRKARKNAKKKGRGELSKEYVSRAHLNLFITNASLEQIPSENVWSLYRLRWQVELIFKIWKSICKIDKIKKVKKHRLECYIYSKVTFIVLGWQMIWKIALHLYVNEYSALSYYKSFKTLVRKKIMVLRDIVMLGKGSIGAFMIEFYEISRIYHLLDKKLQEPTSLEILLSCVIY